MKILATFDGTKFSESIMPLLQQMAALPAAEFILLAVAHEPSGKLRRRGLSRPVVVSDAVGRGTPIIIQPGEPTFAEDKGRAIERRIAEMDDYLLAVAHRLPAGVSCNVEAHVSDDVAQVIGDRAREDHVDVIVMATHSKSGIAHALVGSTTEHVVRSGVAPVLLVHPQPEP
jgi:nucleotide-binding universal stress UspA family protein